MTRTADTQPTLLTDLGGGLIMRRATPDDTEALADFNTMIHRDPGVTEPDEGVAAWTRELLEGRHPTFAPGDFTIVVEETTGKIVSSLNLISQIWSYAGIPIKVGRPELVGTAPAYRNRGLVRAQFDVIHGWSAERGEVVQAITGIPFFYRQFGYEMAMLLGGGRRGYPAEFPSLKEGQSESFVLRPASEGDVPFVMAVDSHAARRSLVYCVRDEAMWRYELFGKGSANVGRLAWKVLESAGGEPAGLVGHSFRLEGGRLGVSYVELRPGLSWLKAAPSILRGLAAVGERVSKQENRTLASLSFWSGPEHPLFVAADGLLPHVRRPYAWYLRVPDLPGFVRRIGRVLEERLADSVAVGHSGELKLSLYREGFRLVIEDGRMVLIEPWQPSRDDQGSAGFPGLSFLQLLFGYRTLGELLVASADCWVDGDEPRVLLNILFPSRPSSFWPVA